MEHEVKSQHLPVLTFILLHSGVVPVHLTMESLFIVSLSKQVKALVSPLNADTHIAESEVEKLIRKMLLKLISTTQPVTVSPFSQFLEFISK